MIYFVVDKLEKYVKIGHVDVEDTVNDRLREIQANCPIKLYIRGYFKGDKGSFKYERELHKRFQKYHVRGEWFYFSKEIKDFINIEINKYPIKELHKFDIIYEDGDEHNICPLCGRNRTRLSKSDKSQKGTQITFNFY